MPLPLKFTSAALSLSVLYSVVVLWFDLDVFEGVFSFLTKLERWEIDEVVFPLFMLVLALCLDVFVWREKRNSSREKAEIRQTLETRCLDLAKELETQFAREADKQAVVHDHIVKLKSLSQEITSLHDDDLKDISSYM